MGAAGWGSTAHASTNNKAPDTPEHTRQSPRPSVNGLFNRQGNLTECAQCVSWQKNLIWEMCFIKISIEKVQIQPVDI